MYAWHGNYGAMQLIQKLSGIGIPTHIDMVQVVLLHGNLNVY
jgi:hypothetical protein